MDQVERVLPHLPHLSITPNLVSTGGFVYGIETAYLGNCLSTFGNLVAFALRTGTPVIYPQLMDHAALFEFTDIRCPFGFNPKGPLAFDPLALESFAQFTQGTMERYFDSYMEELRTLPPEWLSHLGSVSNATVFLRYDMQFRDWGVYESTVANSAARGNAIVIPGAYWWQYRTLPTEAAETVRRLLPLKHHDAQIRRAAMMADAGSGLRIGVHVRRGDYQNYRNGEYYWDISTYVDVMRSISRWLGEQPHLFVLCSNGIWTDEQLAGLPCCYEQGSSFDDFVALSQCDHVVGPPSTYANWASFLGRTKRLVLTPELLGVIDQIGLAQSQELSFPTASGVAGDFWVTP